jgi:hypothetical protein
MADVFRTLGALVPDLPFFGGQKTPLGDVAEMRMEMAAAGFSEVEAHEVTHELETPSIEDFLQTMERSAPPFHMVREKIGPEQWIEVRRALVDSLRAKWGSGPQHVPMIAVLGVGRV